MTHHSPIATALLCYGGDPKVTSVTYGGFQLA
jgi:hypothetical protein